MTQVLTTEECKKILSRIGFKYGVSPNLISRRLLSDLDKGDMLGGVMDISSLEASVEVWRDNGMPDYANGKFEPYKAEKKRVQYEKMQSESQPKEDKKLSYRKPFVEYRNVD